MLWRVFNSRMDIPKDTYLCSCFWGWEKRIYLYPKRCLHIHNLKSTVFGFRQHFQTLFFHPLCTIRLQPGKHPVAHRTAETERKTACGRRTRIITIITALHSFSAATSNAVFRNTNPSRICLLEFFWSKILAENFFFFQGKGKETDQGFSVDLPNKDTIYHLRNSTVQQ